MKKYLLLFLAVSLCVVLISWGGKGHQAVGLIAENHLTPQTKAAVDYLLEGKSMAEVASWADEVRNEPAYKETAPWHFLNEPLGLTYQQFSKDAGDLEKSDVYSAIVKAEHVLEHQTNPKAQRVEALKFLIHFIGDCHQPMHISRSEDKGGNTIQVQFDGKGTNLHSLWDGKLIDQQGLTVQQMSKNYDIASPNQIKQWQNDPLITWLWESYQISSQLYKDVEAKKNIDEGYYGKYILVIQKRIDQAGIRLAGELNRVFKDAHTSLINAEKVSITAKHVTDDSLAVVVELKDLPGLYGKAVAVEGKVYGSKDFGSMVLVNVGAAYPNQLLTIVLKGNAKSLVEKIDGKNISVIGTVVDYKGKPEIIVNNSSEITILK